MFETLTYLQLQQYWWIIISLLGGLFVYIMFVQGGQTLLNTLSDNETEKTMLVNGLDDHPFLFHHPGGQLRIP